MSATVTVHLDREPLELKPSDNSDRLILYVGAYQKESIFFDRNSAEVIGRRLLKWAAPELLEPQYPAPQPVVEPFRDSYDLADEARRIALDSARLLAGEVQP